MEKKKKTYITVDELRERLSISRTLAYRLATDGDIETVKIGRCLRVSEDSLNRWLESARVAKGVVQ